MSETSEDEIDWQRVMDLAGPVVVEVPHPDPRTQERLRTSRDFQRICAELVARHPDYSGTFTGSMEAMLLHWVPVALDPPLEEVLSASERKRIGDKIAKHAKGLSDALEAVLQRNGSFAYPFQPALSRFSVLAAVDDYETWKDFFADDPRPVIHRARFAIYYAVTQALGDLLANLEWAADEFGQQQAKVSRPNNPNARRLYFLRFLTDRFMREVGAPCRRATLELASMFFDCSDLDEAAVSKLAPVRG